MEGGPKSLNAGLKFDDEGNDGEGTDEPGQTENTSMKTLSWLHKSFNGTVLSNVVFVPVALV